MVGEEVIFPLMNQLGIDSKSKKVEVKQTWSDLRSFFDEKVARLQRLKTDFGKTRTGKGQLISTCIGEVIITIERQLSKMDYFKHSDSQPADGIECTPLTNLGCESEFAKLDNRIKRNGGSASVQNYSMKNIVATNGLLVDSTSIDKTEVEKRDAWKWARTSEEVKKVKKLEKDFLETVKLAQHLALTKKEDLKRKGPVTASCLGLLDTLNEKQLLLEITYLRLTVSPDIRQKRRVLVDGKIRFQTFTKPELVRSIKSVIKPETDMTQDIDSLLRMALKGQLPT